MSNFRSPEINPANIPAILAGIEFFKPLNPEQLITLPRHFKTETYQPLEKISRDTNILSIIRTGKIILESDASTLRNLRLSPGQFFGRVIDYPDHNGLAWVSFGRRDWEQAILMQLTLEELDKWVNSQGNLPNQFRDRVSQIRDRGSLAVASYELSSNI